MKRRYSKKFDAIKPYLKWITLTQPEDGKPRRYPFSIPAIQSIKQLDFHPDITFLIGENGSGKSTLMEAIASIMNLGAQGGTGNFIKINDAGGHSGLDTYMRATKSITKPRDRFFLRAESFYNVSTFLEEMADNPDNRTSRAEVFQRYGGREFHQRSHGEAFMSLLIDGLGGNGLYLFDEPEAALSPTRQLAALVRIKDLVKKQSQFIIATHSPILMSYPGALIYLLDESGCRQVAYEETEHFRVTRDFLINYQHRLKHLLSDTPLLDPLDEEEDETEEEEC